MNVDVSGLVVLPVPHVFIGSKFALAFSLLSLYKSNEIENDNPVTENEVGIEKFVIEDMTESINYI